MENEIETVIQIMERTPGHRPPIVGAPTRCPDCGEWGLVDHCDHNAASNHCYQCGNEWTLTRRAVTAVASNVTFIDSLAEPDRRGALFDPEPVPLRSRLAHPSSARTTTSEPGIDLDAPVRRRPELRLAFSNGRRVQPVGA